MTLHQVHRLVQLALGAMTVGFAALAGTFRKSTPKKPLARGQLGNAGTEVAFGGREFGADEGLGHVLKHILYKIRMESKSKNAIRICPSLDSGPKHQWNQMIWLTKKLRLRNRWRSRATSAMSKARDTAFGEVSPDWERQVAEDSKTMR